MSWSSPDWVSRMLVITQNAYAAATVKVESDQTLTSDGLYGLVRHPMYTGNADFDDGHPLGTRLVLGAASDDPGLVALAFRILDEEGLLNRELTGYREYTQRVRYRLLPHVW